DDGEDLQDRRKPSIQLDKEPAIVVRKPGPAAHLTSQNDQLMSECHVLCFKPALRLEWRGEQGRGQWISLSLHFSRINNVTNTNSQSNIPVALMVFLCMAFPPILCQELALSDDRAILSAVQL
ncbi:MAG TPA: hypothetical protein VIM36_12645, partial [Gemmatimonadaceae bacterium]